MKKTSDNLMQVAAENMLSYKTIDENIYRFERIKNKSKKEVRRMLCECTLSKEEIERNVAGCDDDCLNRLLMLECGSRCATGASCSNKRFQKKQYTSIEPFKTEKKGWGLRVLKDVKAGDFVIEYIGEVLSRHEFKQRVKQYAREKCDHYYFMALRNDEVIDATLMGNLSRFINHSCSPNCETQKWTVNGDLRIGFFTTKSLSAGEELTFDYKLQRYGREAQKCYCESENCTGFIGESAKVPSDGNKTVKKEKSVEEKKRQAFKDLMFDEELEKLCCNNKLRNREDTLVLARLMVRAEDLNSRLRLLDLILSTTEVACLQLFVNYHGLSLLWSWMADGSALNRALKFKILQVLSFVPVPNKTVLLDSKVLHLVQKWSTELPSLSSSSDNCDKHELKQSPTESPPSKSKSSDSSPQTVKSSDSSKDSDELNDSPQMRKSECLISEEKAENEEDSSAVSKSNNSQSPSHDSSESSSKTSGSAVNSDDDSSDTPTSAQPTADEEERFNTELPILATKLLESWANLKEAFRIPRLDPQKHRAEDLYGYLSAKHRDHDDSVKGIAIETISLRRFAPKGLDDVSRNRKDENDIISGRIRTLLPTPRVMTKEERRQLFEMEIQQQDQELLQKQYEETYAAYNEYYNSAMYPDGTQQQQQLYPPQVPHPLLTEEQLLQQQQLPDMSLLQAQGYGENVPMQVPGYSENIPMAGVPTGFEGLPTTYPMQYGVQYPNTQPQPVQYPYLGPQPVTTAALTNPALHTSTMAIPENMLPLVNIPGQCPIQQPPVQGVPGVLAPQQTSSPCLTGTTFAPPSTLMSTLPPVYSIPGQNTVPTGAPIPASYVPNASPYVGNPNQMMYPFLEQFTPDQLISPQLVKPVVKKKVRLPPHWKTAKDTDGEIYYYHSITRETQWDPPECDDSLDIDDSPEYDEVRRKSVTTAVADSSLVIEAAKKIKERFRSKLSSYVVQCLNPYRKSECTFGRITNTEDFKHLARKLTHFVMAKELKHCINAEELDCNDSVKHKAKDYVVKYMAKFGSVYKKS